MFGLDKLFGGIGGGIFGKFFDSIGMPWMSNVLSLATNVATGNWLGAAKDVFDLVSKFSSDNSWMNKVAQFQPLGEFDQGGCFGSGALSQSRADELRSRVGDDNYGLSTNSSRTILIAHETVHNNALANNHLRQAHVQGRI